MFMAGECVWTGTQADGTLSSSDTKSSTCSDWSSGTTGTATIGQAGASGPEWTSYVTNSCFLPCHLYCFQL